TARLLLRPFEEADARRVAYLAGAYDVAKMCGRVPHPYMMASAYDFIDMTRAGRDSGAEHAFAVTAPIDGLVGSCGVMRVGGEESATYEIGYWFGMPYWGLGYASESARALMDWARDELGAKAFGAGHFVDNPASGNVLRKLGFAPSGGQDLFSLARQGSSPAARYVWSEGATPVSLADHPGAHARH
ncbi:MAG: GNAT family N-acetyltransferase, partial [Hyphomonadaceae bacterium]|nr:GNAT family N-acetyltransferase [Hyphomonadaceae bacterium]